MYESNNSFGVDKYLIKNKGININRHDNRKEMNKYKFVYSPYKMIQGMKKEINKDDLFNDDENSDIIGDFNFQRRHHFS